MKTYKSLTAVSFALLLLAACGSSGIGDILGGGSNGGTNNGQTYEIRGVVDSVDSSGRSVYLTNVSGYTSMLSNGGGGSTARVYFSDQTQVDYQGKAYRPEDLERGDEVTVRVDESGNRLNAQSMTVVYDATNGTSGSSGSLPTGTYGSTVRGTVSYVDTSRRTIEVNRGSGSPLIVEYATNTPVYYNNQTYTPADLERGDEIDVRVTNLGSNRYSAQDITVVRNVSGGSGGINNGSTSSAQSTIRGTISYIDTSRRTIELESASWISGFQSGAGTGNRVTVTYDNNTSVDVQGRLYPVSNLERGDLVEVSVYNGSSSALSANRIVLVRDVNAR